MVDSCRECNPCQQGLEQYCDEGNVQTYNGHDRHDHQPTYGGYSRTIIASEAFVLQQFDGIIQKAKAGCPVSQVLKAEISLDYKLN